MNYIYEYFNNSSKITINSAKPEDLNSSVDILAIIINEFPKVNPNYIIVSNPHENLAIIVGNNINIQGIVKVHITETKSLLKGENKNATCWDYTISE